MGKPSAPAAPDYVGAAQATAGGNLEMTRAAQAGSMIGQNTPYGSLSYTQNGTDQFGNPMYTANTTLSEAQQQMLDASNQAGITFGNLANQGLMNVGQTLANPGIDNSKLTAMPTNAGMTAQDAIMSRLAPQMERQSAATEQQLANQGIALGSDAYRTAKEEEAQRQNDAMTSAAAQGINIDSANRQQGVQEQIAGQNQIMNQLNALRTGSQVQSPNFTETPGQQAASGPDMMAAASGQGAYNQGLYNSQMAANNSQNAGLASLGSSLIGRYSDRRLKRNIVRIGTHKLGIGLYEFDYIWGEHSTGVMSDEVRKVMPDAVIVRGGFDMVNYGMLG